MEEATSSNEVALKEPDSSETNKDGSSIPNNHEPSRDKVIEKQISSLSKSGKRSVTEAVIEISDSDSDGSSVCAVDSYKLSTDEAKRMRRDYSSSSLSSYSSEEDECDSSFEDDSVVIDYKDKISKFSQKNIELNKRASRDEKPILNKTFNSNEHKIELIKHWNDKKVDKYEYENVNIISEPFNVGIIENFLENSEYINNIVDDMNTMDWNRKRMDLYEFHQTADLANLTWQRSIASIYDLLKKEVMPWISEVTNTKLTHISASCSLYGPGDHLLVHDDLMDDRKVAFIFYILPWNLENESGWHETFGGELELFNSNAQGRPWKGVEKILPKNNSFAFFKVGKHTFHQVREILSYEYPRLSINGWFHGPDEEHESIDKENSIHEELEMLPPNHEIIILSEWLSPIYQLPRSRMQIQRHLEESSEISLDNFFTEAKFKSICEALRSTDLWEESGPADLRKYDTISATKLNEVIGDNALRDWYNFMTSNHCFNFLIMCTELKLSACCDVQIERWTHGCYTTLQSKERYAHCELDTTMYIDWSDHYSGGTTTYIAPEDTHNEPLVTLAPTTNSLNLVYSDEGTARFTKYVSKLSADRDKFFYILRATYRE